MTRGRGVARSNAAVPLLPLASSGDPERQQNQLEIEPEARAFQIDAIEPELARPADVARGVDLGEAGETGPHTVARLVAGDLIQPHHLPIAARFHFARPQRP